MVSRVFVSAHGNVFMREIADHLAEALSGLGRDAVVVTGDLPAATADPLDNLVVAPHEFFGLFPVPEAEAEAAAAHAASINTEQAGTPFFERAMQFARHGRVVFDINPFSLASIRRRGLPAVHLPLGYVPSMDHWRRREAPRPVDIALLAGRTARRERFLGGAASQLWEWRTDLRMFSWHRPILGGVTTFLAGEAKYETLAGARILLNVHRSDDPYFEWARVVEAAANGCVVVTETSTGTEPFVAGEHFVEAPLEYLAEQAVALALDEPRRARIALAAHEVLTTQLDQTALLGVALRAGHEAAARTPRTVRLRRPHPVTEAAPARRAAATLRRALRPTPVAREAETAQLRAIAAGLKRTYLDQVDHTRALERAMCIAVHGDPDPISIEHTRTWDDADPRISVVIPLHDQGRYLEEAVRSVLAACAGEASATEIVIVDDRSNDDSAAVAAKLLTALDWFPISLVRRAANGGLSLARNTGFAVARGPYVFTLDADNAIYPTGLRKLVRALEAAPADVIAVYGILERFDETGSVGVTSHLPWDVDLLVQGAYIDAMALFRRDAWQRLGGYADPPGIGGWEDYDLWLRAAAQGMRAQLVAEIVGRYREHAGSMRRISDIDMAGSFITLRERHPRLAWPS